jgi:hypothetical protein|tara:strand:+ start:1781 stop:1999 length:219 start_codon:yes stop_codon:yes gene_type:complete
MNANNLRIIGSASLLIGYFLLLYLDVRIGCTFRLVGGCFMLPFAISIKTWDVVGLQTFFAVIDASKIIQLSL